MLLVVAWDGASLDTLEPLVEAGELPRLASLIRGGAVREVESTWPAVTFPAWTTFLTAADPDLHGVTDFTIRDGYSVRFVGAGERHLPTIFRRMSQAGARVGLYAVPATYPPESLNGIQVCGFDTPLGAVGGPRSTQPRSLYGELSRRYGGLGNAGPSQMRIEAGWHEQALETMLGEIALRTRIVCDLIREQRFDCFMVHYGESDTVSHQFRQFCDPQSPRYRNDGPASAMRDVYRAMDAGLAALIDAAGTDTTVMVVSDHGSMGASDQAVFLNTWLAARGYLSFSGQRLHTGALGWLRRSALRMVPERWAPWLFSRLQPAVGRVESAARFGGIDWSATRVFSEELNYFPALWINRKGREPCGVVGDAEVGDLIEALREDLAEFRHPVSGDRVVVAVRAREELYAGRFARRVPDLVLELAEPGGYAYSCGSSRGGREREVLRQLSGAEMTGARGTSMAGAHSRMGMSILHGPGIRCGRFGDGCLADAGATVLALQGLAASAGANGRPWYDLLEELAGGLSEVEVDTDEGPAYSKEEEREVAERLRALGYLD